MSVRHRIQNEKSVVKKTYKYIQTSKRDSFSGNLQTRAGRFKSSVFQSSSFKSIHSLIYSHSNPRLIANRASLAFRSYSFSARTLFRLARNNSRSEEHTSELQSRQYLVCRLLLEKKQ